MRIHTHMSWLSSIYLNFQTRTLPKIRMHFDTKYHLFLRDIYAITIVSDNQY